MDNFTATMIAEGVEDADEERQIEAWQHLIDTGLAWKLQGSFGRQAKRMIEMGICHAARCERCKGTGRVPDWEEPEASEDGLMPCPSCEGSGTE